MLRRVYITSQPVQLERKNETVVIKPSTWAILDVLTLSVFNDMFPDSPVCKGIKKKYENGDGPSGAFSPLQIRETAVIRSSNALLNRCRYLIVNFDGLDTPTRSGDIISFKIVNEPKINGQSISSFGWSSTSSGFRNKSVLAEVGFTWTPLPGPLEHFPVKQIHGAP